MPYLCFPLPAEPGGSGCRSGRRSYGVSEQARHTATRRPTELREAAGDENLPVRLEGNGPHRGIRPSAGVEERLVERAVRVQARQVVAPDAVNLGRLPPASI